MKRSEVPQQGLLKGVRVAVSAISVAGPFAAEILADMGADVIQIENPKNPDYSHGSINPGWMGESHRRNMRDITLDVTKPKGREARPISSSSPPKAGSGTIGGWATRCSGRRIRGLS